jgi:hypothetical protein
MTEVRLPTSWPPVRPLARKGDRVRILLPPAGRLLRTAIEAISARAFPPPVSLSQVNFVAAGGSGGPDHTPSEKLVSACNPPSGSVESPGLVSSSGLR